MRWKEAADQYCSIARTLGILGDRWTLLIIREAFSGVRRFDDFRRHLGIARNVLTERLQRLVDAEILELHTYQERPPRQEYRLSDRGRDLHGVLLTLMQWGDRWLAGDQGPPLTVEHLRCRRIVTPALICPVCGEPLDARSYRLRPGPGLPAEVAEAREQELAHLRARRG